MGARVSRRGFSLLLMGATLTILVAMLGIAVDLSRMYISKSELQAFVDAAALSAAQELDGTAAGIARAMEAGRNGPGANRWNFSTERVAVSPEDVTFAQAFKGSYVPQPLAPEGYRFVRVQARVTVPMYFLPVLPGVGVSRSLTVAAVAGQGIEKSVGSGLSPFVVVAPKPDAPGFGLRPGHHFKLTEGGLIDTGQGDGDSGVREAIVNNTFGLQRPFSAGTVLNIVKGQTSTSAALRERFDQDTDIVAARYSDYAAARKGNGRRVMTVALSDGANPPKIAGFASLFLLPDALSGEFVHAGICRVKLFL